MRHGMIWLLTATLLLGVFGPANAQASDWEFLKNIPTPENQWGIIRLGADSTGRVYLSNSAISGGGVPTKMVVYYSDDLLTAETPTFEVLFEDNDMNNGMQGLVFDAADNIYVAGDKNVDGNGSLRKFDAAGNELWKVVPPLRAMGAGKLSDGTIITCSFDGRLQAFDPATGDFLTSNTTTATGNFVRGIVIVDDVIYGVRSNTLIKITGGGPGNLAGYDTVEVVAAKDAPDPAFQVRPNVIYSAYDNTLIMSNVRVGGVGENAVFVLDLETETEIQTITERAPGSGFDQPGGLALVDGNDGYIYLIVSSFWSQVSVYRKAAPLSLIVAGAQANVYDQAEFALGLKVAGDDLIQGQAGTILSGGFHDVYTGGVGPLTNGTFDANGSTALFADYQSTEVEYDLLSNTRIDEIRIFSGHLDAAGASRVFINCEVEVDYGSGYVPLGVMKTGEFGTPAPLGGSAVAYARLFPDVAGAKKILFRFHNVAHNETGFFQAHNDNTTNPPMNYPNQGSIIKEIDVIGGEVPAAAGDWVLHLY